MKVRTSFGIASLVAAAALVTVAIIVLPSRVWTPVTTASLLTLGAAVGLGLYLPFRLPQGPRGGDAATIASMGPMALIGGAVLILAVVSFIVALLGFNAIAWAMIVVNIAGFTIANLALRGTSQVVDQAAARNASPSQRSLWIAQVQSMLSNPCPPSARAALSGLVEKLRYAASDLGVEAPIDLKLAHAVESLQQCTAAGEGEEGHVIALAEQVSALLDQREVFLKAARSRV